MVRTRLQRCSACGEYGLATRCKKCGAAMVAVSPMKYSAEEPEGARSMKMLDVGSEEWL